MQYAPPDRRHAVQYAPPARHHAAQCAVAAHGSRREAARDATLGRPDQIVMLKLLRESRNKNLDFLQLFCD